MVHNPRSVRQYVKVHDKTQDLYQDTNWSYGQKTQKGWLKWGDKGVPGDGGGWGEAGGMRGLGGKVHAKTSGLYQVPNWGYGQKTQKRGWERGVQNLQFHLVYVLVHISY